MSGRGTELHFDSSPCLINHQPISICFAFLIFRQGDCLLPFFLFFDRCLPYRIKKPPPNKRRWLIKVFIATRQRKNF